MRRLPLLIVAAAAAAAAALVLAVGGSAQGPNPHTIQLVEREVQTTDIHTPREGSRRATSSCSGASSPTPPDSRRGPTVATA
jgi:hypothetical protein